jgi:hypothetical protein
VLHVRDSTRALADFGRDGRVGADDLDALQVLRLADAHALDVERTVRLFGEAARPGVREVTLHVRDERVDVRPGDDAKANAAVDVLDPGDGHHGRARRARRRREPSAHGVLERRELRRCLLVCACMRGRPLGLAEVPLGGVVRRRVGARQRRVARVILPLAVRIVLLSLVGGVGPLFRGLLAVRVRRHLLGLHLRRRAARRRERNDQHRPDCPADS